MPQTSELQARLGSGRDSYQPFNVSCSAGFERFGRKNVGDFALADESTMGTVKHKLLAKPAIAKRRISCKAF